MSRIAIGVDIGGTKIAVGAVDEAGAVKARRTVATDAEAGFEAGLARLARAVDETMAEAGVEPAALAGIGLGCPGPFDEASGRIDNFYTLPGWEGNDILSPLVARFGTPVRLVNDADAALLGEALAGAARGARIAVMLTVGTGIGGAALIDGAILRGAGGEHPEIGHVVVDPAGPECYCGSRGCIEALAAGPALARAGAAHGYADAEAVFAAAEAGDAPARAIVARSADAMETGVWSLIHAFLPEVILIGGGMGERHFTLYRGAAERAVARAVLAPKGAIRVVKAALGNDAGMVGAAALMLEPA
ncbi:MAG: ROK family protein [Rhodospirillales bacterium]|nr:ROK family protein [Rhodospirillales bacterium]MDE0378727.1 ROK family protein [Rhodospirillales bacterium]